MPTLSLLRRMLEPLANRIRLVASRGVIRATDDSTGVQTVQVSALAGELLGRVERLEGFGIASRAPAGTEALLVCLGGSRDSAIVVSEQSRTLRPRGVLAEGEVLLYAAGGARVHVRAGGVVEIQAAGGVTVSARLTAGGDVVSGGDVFDSRGALDVLRQAYNVHTHSDPQGGVTGPPTPTV